MTEFVNNVFDLFTLRPMDSGFRWNDGMSFKMSTLPSKLENLRRNSNAESARYARPTAYR